MKAFLFDLNGTMIDDMQFHLEIWFRILTEELGASMTRDEVRSHMYGKNQELLVRVFGAERFSAEEADVISQNKEERYQEHYRPSLKLLPGLPEFLEDAKRKKIPMAIGSAASPFNINFVLDNLSLHHYFGGVISGSDVTQSKPHPETFLKAAALLNVKPEDCIVFEDAPKGVEAAERAGMKCVVLTTMHTPDEFSQYANILMFTADYKTREVTDLLVI